MRRAVCGPEVGDPVVAAMLTRVVEGLVRRLKSGLDPSLPEVDLCLEVAEAIVHKLRRRGLLAEVAVKPALEALIGTVLSLCFDCCIIHSMWQTLTLPWPVQRISQEMLVMRVAPTDLLAQTWIRSHHPSCGTSAMILKVLNQLCPSYIEQSVLLCHCPSFYSEQPHLNKSHTKRRLQNLRLPAPRPTQGLDTA